MAAPDFSKLSLVLIAMAFHLHLFCMGTSGKYSDNDPDEEDTDTSIKAMLVLAFVCYIFGLIACLLMSFEDMANKVVSIVTIVVILCGGGLIGFFNIAQIVICTH